MLLREGWTFREINELAAEYELDQEWRAKVAEANPIAALMGL